MTGHEMALMTSIAVDMQGKEVNSVFDKISAEIEQEYNRLRATRTDEILELGECLGLKLSLKIIDKYRADIGGK